MTPISLEKITYSTLTYWIKSKLFKIWRTCRIFRPPGTTHCNIWNHWVLKFDHHCTWIGSCVGKNNYKYFIAFLSSLNLLAILVVIHSIFVLFIDNNDSTGDYIISNITQNPFSVLLLILTVPLLILVMILYLLHLYLIYKNTTTYQFIVSSSERRSHKKIITVSRSKSTSKPLYPLK